MTWVKVAAGIAAAGFMAAAHAASTVLDEGFDKVAGRGASDGVASHIGIDSTLV